MTVVDSFTGIPMIGRRKGGGETITDIYDEEEELIDLSFNVTKQLRL